MKNTLIAVGILCLLVLGFMSLPTPPAQVAPSNVTIITNAQIFDGEQWIGKKDVAFKAGIIVEVASNLNKKYKDANVVDGTDQYLIPGLIDAHTHAWDLALSQAVKFGVTTELDMFTNNAFASIEREKRFEHDKDNQQADLFSAGTLVTAPKGHGTEYGFSIETIKNAQQASTFVQARISEGSDYIKIVYDARQHRMPSIDKETLRAVITASHQQGKLAVVHISDVESAKDAIAAGANGLVHGFMDDVDIKLLAQEMARNKQFVIPTLSILASMMGQNRTDKLIADFSTSPRFGAQDSASQLASMRGQRGYPQAFKQAQINTGILAKAGVLVLAGTDAPNPGTAHGISLHGELELLVEAGLSENQALKAATSNVAQAFNLVKRGYIKPLMKADLVLLSKDPQQNITHTRAIAAVYKNGFEVKYDQGETSTTLNKSVTLGDFDQDMNSNFDIAWQPTSDERFGGNSVVKITRDNSNQKDFLRITGEVKNKFSYPWAGAFSSFSIDNEKTVSLAEITTISFNAKGSAGRYKVMLFSTKQPMRPLEINFNVSEDWQTKTLSLAHFAPALLSSVTGIAIVATPPSSVFELMVDDVWLNHQ